MRSVTTMIVAGLAVSASGCGCGGASAGAGAAGASNTGAAAACTEGMVAVPAGTFEMGSPAGAGADDERPQRTVTLRAYCLDRTEVTVEAYRRCVDGGGCSEPDAEGRERCTWGVAGKEQHPVNCVDWTQAQAYCGWSGKRLPTEAEWELAARGTDGRTYPWGDEAPDAGRLNGCGAECGALPGRAGSPVMYEGDDGWAATAPVGSYPAGASPYGAQDLAGNEWEWVSDWYGEYAAGAVEDPTGPSRGEHRVYRGGGWINDDAGLVRAASRGADRPAYRDSGIGFRCARGD
jgi:formylglycine-generating enzyme required for sulfatase activity